MLVVIGHLRFPPGTRAAVLAALTEVVITSRAEAGCLFYDFAEDVIEPDLFRVSEGWRDAEALRTHFASTHFQQFSATREGLGMTERVVAIYETPGPTTV